MTQKCIGVLAAVAVMGFSAAKADIGNTIMNAKSGTTVSCSGSYTVSEQVSVPSGVTVSGGTFNFTTKYNTTAGMYFNGGSDQKCENLTVTGANHGIDLESSGGQAVSCVAHNNYNDGIIIGNSGGKSSTISGCTSYSNDDTQNDGDNADGIGVKNSSGTGNVVENCTVYENADDGFDYENAGNPVKTSGCTAYNNGQGSNGDGNGFKMGIGGQDVAHTYTSCTAYDETKGSSPKGFSTNGNTGKISLNECHSYSNKDADVLGNCVLTSCTMQTN